VTSAITDQEALNVSPEHSRVLLAASSRCGSRGRIRLSGIAKGRCFKNGCFDAADFAADFANGRRRVSETPRRRFSVLGGAVRETVDFHRLQKRLRLRDDAAGGDQISPSD
jgi:hypothetical protein